MFGGIRKPSPQEGRVMQQRTAADPGSVIPGHLPGFHSVSFFGILAIISAASTPMTTPDTTPETSKAGR